ncbi:hypothetical protein DKX38_008993 [Salix brachista]|uniref:Uncharacterized protein n=1 Tax=Salix brachista TaxID=2182728 RepID=A0A5N5M9X9_9ROSI|nr:hypothetical protein DKX38_008993 [Salix brachista]
MLKNGLGDVALKTVAWRTLGTADPPLTSPVRYLIHDCSEYVTGKNVVVDAEATLTGVPLLLSGEIVKVHGGFLDDYVFC